MSDEVNNKKKTDKQIADTSKIMKWQGNPPVKAKEAIDRVRQVAFLRALAKIGTISASCKAAGIYPGVELRWRNSGDKWYAERFREALQEYRDTISEEIHNRAVIGEQVPIVGKVQTEFGPEDKIIGYKTVKSDLLLMFHAKKVIPEYKDKYQAPPDSDKPKESVSPLVRISINLDTMAARKNGTENIIDITPEPAQLTDGSENDE